MDDCAQNAEKNVEICDHRKIGKEMELFSFHKEGPGFPFFLPKGILLKNQLVEFWREHHYRGGYREIQSPIMLDRSLWEKSGHWQLFKENMYVSEIDKRAFAIKPMNCPGAILYFQERPRSHRELPFRICEMGQCHRDERSGALHGLMRVRSFVVDDAHIFCSRDQIYQEVSQIIELAMRILKSCGFNDFKFELSVRGREKAEKYLGSDEDWQVAEDLLQRSIEQAGYSFERRAGEAKFYGPAIDLKIKDSTGRDWQCSSIQMDFNLARRFSLAYFDGNGERQVPYIIHRCIFGSLERFMGILLEHHKGFLPPWLAPIQLKVLVLSQDRLDYVEELSAWLRESRIRFEVDAREINLSSKIKQAQQERVPLMLLIGKKEIQGNKVSLRWRDGRRQNLVDKEVLLSLLGL